MQISVECSAHHILYSYRARPYIKSKNRVGYLDGAHAKAGLDLRVVTIIESNKLCISVIEMGVGSADPLSPHRPRLYNLIKALLLKYWP